MGGCESVCMDTQSVPETYEGTMADEVGYGDSPAVIVIDLQNGFTDPDHSLGSDLTEVVRATNRLLDSARGSDVPVIFTRVVTRDDDGADLGIWTEKIPSLAELAAGSEWVELDDDLNDEDGDYVLDKRQASAFHETELGSVLNYYGVDTTILLGCSTSGCVRATAVDACSAGYHVIVPEGGVGDRVEGPHEANLVDIHSKYGDVRTVDDVDSYLRSRS